MAGEGKRNPYEPKEADSRNDRGRAHDYGNYGDHRRLHAEVGEWLRDAFGERCRSIFIRDFPSTAHIRDPAVILCRKHGLPARQAAGHPRHGHRHKR